MRILGSTTGWESQIHYFSRPSFPKLALFGAIIVPSLSLCCMIHQCQGFLDEAYFSHQDSGILTKAPRAPSQFHVKDSLILIPSFHIQATCRPCCCSISCLFSFHACVHIILFTCRTLRCPRHPRRPRCRGAASRASRRAPSPPAPSASTEKSSLKSIPA